MFAICVWSDCSKFPPAGACSNEASWDVLTLGEGIIGPMLSCAASGEEKDEDAVTDLAPSPLSSQRICDEASSVLATIAESVSPRNEGRSLQPLEENPSRAEGSTAGGVDDCTSPCRVLLEESSWRAPFLAVVDNIAIAAVGGGAVNDVPKPIFRRAGEAEFRADKLLRGRAGDAALTFAPLRDALLVGRCWLSRDGVPFLFATALSKFTVAGDFSRRAPPRSTSL
mmetsp:Transcript_2607/g.6051  ORF Transcript_2607/g.6051 Transcript_2607/m.6051 type:complete len:226 (-) Transcript_2607:51-728(-)